VKKNKGETYESLSIKGFTFASTNSYFNVLMFRSGFRILNLWSRF